MNDSVEHAWLVPGRLRALAPEPAAILDRLNRRIWSTYPPELVEGVRLRVAAMIGNRAGLDRRSSAAAAAGLTEAKIEHLGDYFRSDDYSEVERDVLVFMEQFVMDVSMFREPDTEDLRQRYGPDAVQELIIALFVTEFTQRLEVAASALLGIGAAGPVADVPPDFENSTLKQVLAEYQAAVMRLKRLDPVLTELVRLRCARTHDCRICQTLRATDARTAGADEAMTDKIDFYERSDLDERTKTALRITDALITTPDLFTAALIDQARAAFSPAELAELCFDISKWSTQKIKISLRLDGAESLAVDESGVSFFEFDDEGRPIRRSVSSTGSARS